VRANGTPVWYSNTRTSATTISRLARYNDFNFYCWVLFVKTYLLD
jgi:hypothetical protein